MNIQMDHVREHKRPVTRHYSHRERQQRNYDITFFWLKLEFTASNKPGAQDILFVSTCWCIDAVVSCIIRWDTMTKHKQIFVYKPD